MTARRDSPSDAVKMRVLRRDGYRCSYCGSQDELQIDHVVPVAKGGSHHIGNLTTACRKCNQSKGDRMDYQPTPRHQSAIFVHLLKQGRIQYQGQIIGTDGDILAVQLFSFIDGRPTEVIFVGKSRVQDPDMCKAYSTQEAWIDAYMEEARERK